MILLWADVTLFGIKASLNPNICKNLATSQRRSVHLEKNSKMQNIVSPIQKPYDVGPYHIVPS